MCKLLFSLVEQTLHVVHMSTEGGVKLDECSLQVYFTYSSSTYTCTTWMLQESVNPAIFRKNFIL